MSQQCQEHSLPYRRIRDYLLRQQYKEHSGKKHSLFRQLDKEHSPTDSGARNIDSSGRSLRNTVSQCNRIRDSLLRQQCKELSFPQSPGSWLRTILSPGSRVRNTLYQCNRIRDFLPMKQCKEHALPPRL
jgi:hypothetical protein